MKGVILLSGGLDSATTLAIAKEQGYQCYALSFDYNQRHIAELAAAKNIAASLNVIEHKIIDLDLTQIGGSALTDNNIDVPEKPSIGIPVTYVPARNTIFLSYALAWAEVLGISNIFIGINAVDYSGYPDCRIDYIRAFEQMAALATKFSIEQEKPSIHTPLINLSKAEIIRRGNQLGIDYALTISCYQVDTNGHACGVCDSCRFRKEGFSKAGVPDPTPYR